MSLDIDPNHVFRDFSIDGMPASGKHDPKKVEIREHLTGMWQAVIALVADADPNLTLPNLLVQMTMIGGDENDIEVSFSPEPSSTSLYQVTTAQANTGPVTINGKSVLLGNGDPIPAGYLKPATYLLADAGSAYRVMSYGDAEAIQAAVESYLAAAENAVEQAEAWAEGEAPGGPETKSAREWAQLLGAGTLGSMAFGPFVGDGLRTQFTLPVTPEFPVNVVVFLGGVFQDYEARSVVENQLVFTEPVPDGLTVYGYIMTATKVEIGVPDDGSVGAAKMDAADAPAIRSAINAPSAADVVIHSDVQGLAPVAQARARRNISAALRGHIHGLALSNNATDLVNDIDIAAGEAASDNADPVLMVLPAGLTKRLDAAWAAGSAQGGLDTGSIADNTYHVFLISGPEEVDALFSSSLTPTLPPGFTHRRRIGSIIRASGAIRRFVQTGDLFRLNEESADWFSTNPGTSAHSVSLAVPAGLIVDAQCLVGATMPASWPFVFGLLTPLDAPDVAVGASASGRHNFSIIASHQRTFLPVLTNSNRQVRMRVASSHAELVLMIRTLGWTDRRGQQ